MTSDADADEAIATLKIAGHGHHLMHGPVTIGRDPRADEGATVAVDGDPLVSKSHLCVDIDQSDLIITDLGSSNGTFLHHSAGETAVPSDRWIPIPPDAEIEFGDQRMTVERIVATANADERHASAATTEHADSVWAAEPDGLEPAGDPTPVVAPALAGRATPDDTPLKAVVTCSRCERDLAPASKFCDGCGQRVAPGDTIATTDDDPGPTVVVPSPSSPAPPGAYGQPPPPHAAPDALLHQTGGPVFVDPVAATSRTGGGRRKVLLGAGVLVVAGLIGVALVTVLGGDDDSTASRLGEARTVPNELDELWSTDIAGAAGFPSIGDASVYVASQTESDILITSLAREDGDENWEATIDDADFGVPIGEFDGVVVVSACAFDVETVCSVIGLSMDGGDEIWRESLGDGFAFGRAGSLIADDGEAVMLLEPATGDRLERVRGELVFGDVDALLIDDDGDVTAYDDDLRPLLGPVQVDADAAALAFAGERLLVAVEDEIEYIDTDGDVTFGPFLDGDITRLISIDPSTLVAELGDEVVVYDLDGDDAVERWADDGTIDQVAGPDGGAVVIIDAGDNRLIVDLESGDQRFDVDVDGDIGSTSTLAAANAFVVIDRGDIERPGATATVTTFDWETGDEIWIADFEGNVRVDDIVVVVGTDGDVTVFG